MSIPMNPANKVELQAPGAGLPWWELLVARYVIFPRACRKLDWATAADLFQREGAKILALWDSLSAHRLVERVLIRRIAGIEDSSRFWSVAMTVEHLNIVGFGIRQLLDQLRRRETVFPVPRIQDVKPRGEMNPAEVRSTFVQLLTAAASAATHDPPIPRGEGPRAPHPWFGPLDAHQWHCLLGVHQQIHRKQIEAILGALRGR